MEQQNQNPNQQPQPQPQQPQPIIERIKSPTKKQKTIRLIIIIIISLALLIGIGFLIKNSIEKSNKNRLKPAEEAISDIKQQIEEISQKQKSMDIVKHLQAEDNKNKLYLDQIEKYHQSKKTDEELKVIKAYFQYLVNNNKAEYGVSFIDNFDVKRLSITQKINYYEYTSFLLYYAKHTDKSKEHYQIHRDLQQQLDEQLKK